MAAFLGCLIWSCAGESNTTDPLQTVLESSNPAIQKVMANPEAYEVQIRYTRIDRKNDSIVLTDYDYRVNDQAYFYPASTVKLPIAVLALEKLNRLDSLDRNTSYYVEGDSLEATFKQDIINIFAVSDNHANNRLLEFLGLNAVNDSLIQKGVGPVRIAHRLGIHDNNVTTKPIIWKLNDSTYSQSNPLIGRTAKALMLNGIKKGIAYVSEDSLIAEPFDFSFKNYLPISSLDGVLKRVIFPELFPLNQRFHLSTEQRAFLMESMQITPREAGYDPYQFPDGYCKFFIFGDTNEPIPAALQIYNKVGFAFGTLIDCAYLHDSRNNVEFILTATILVNENKIFNDDKYEYDQIGMPFLAALGRELYNFEAQEKGATKTPNPF
ncbi:MAG: hypothetical protein RLZZ241_791 [Bacteroidota bacterium]|jgi:hypothetical protein